MGVRMSSTDTHTTVLHLIDNFDIGGTQRAALTYAAKVTHPSIRSILGALNGPGPLELEAAARDVQTVCFNGDLSHFRRFLAESNVNVLHLHSGSVKDFEAASVARNSHGAIIIQTNYFGWYDKVASKALPSAILFGAWSSLFRFLRHSGLRSLPTWTRLVIAHAPVECDQFYRNQSSRQSIRREMGLLDSDVLIARVGRPDPRKLDGFPLSALRRLDKLSFNWKFLFIGGVTPALADEIAADPALDRVQSIPGPLTTFEISRLLSACDIYGHTSRVGECPGLAVLEAMASSLPIVYQLTPYADNGLPEIVDEGVCGFAALTPKTFADRTHLMIDDAAVRSRMSQASFCNSRRFSSEVILDGYTKLVLNLVNARVGVTPTAKDVGSSAGVEMLSVPRYEHWFGKAREVVRAKPSIRDSVLAKCSTGYFYCRAREGYFHLRALKYRLPNPTLEVRHASSRRDVGDS